MVGASSDTQLPILTFAEGDHLKVIDPSRDWSGGIPKGSARLQGLQWLIERLGKKHLIGLQGVSEPPPKPSLQERGELAMAFNQLTEHLEIYQDAKTDAAP